jgi:hypothetical protein
MYKTNGDERSLQWRGQPPSLSATPLEEQEPMVQSLRSHLIHFVEEMWKVWFVLKTRNFILLCGYVESTASGDDSVED